MDQKNSIDEDSEEDLNSSDEEFENGKRAMKVLFIYLHFKKKLTDYLQTSYTVFELLFMIFFKNYRLGFIYI